MPDDNSKSSENSEADRAEDANDNATADHKDTKPPAEIGGREAADPTRYGDWEKNGRCVDF